MTRSNQGSVKCWHCNEVVHCRKCHNSVLSGTQFGFWLRGCQLTSGAGYAAHNLDYIWHQFRDDWFITIEEKRYGGESTESQQDTHSIVVRFLQFASDNIEEIFVGFANRRRRAKVEYRGHYVIVFENTTPDDSSWVKINNKEYNNPEETILHLLKTGQV